MGHILQLTDAFYAIPNQLRDEVCVGGGYSGPVNNRNQPIVGEWSKISTYRCPSMTDFEMEATFWGNSSR